jgi:hypothetical protein
VIDGIFVSGDSQGGVTVFLSGTRVQWSGRQYAFDSTAHHHQMFLDVSFRDLRSADIDLWFTM